MNDKPPLGLRPRFIMERNRMIEIFEAMLRYVDADKKVPKKWRKELNELLTSLLKERRAL
jgi:hypothetical protein